MNKNSVHLQDIPNLSFFKSEKELEKNMDLVREVCSMALFIRDKYKLRVRLPLANLKIIGEESKKIKKFKDIISSEVNVKNIEFSDNISELSEFKLQLNFKKIGIKFGAKMKEISSDAKNGNWERISDDNIKISGEILTRNDKWDILENDFEIKLTTKDPEKIFPLLTSDCLIELDLNVTQELQEEGISRDIVRMVQQDRKESNFNVSDHIILKISCSKKIQKIIENYQIYIKNSSLSDEIIICDLKFDQKNEKNIFNHNIDGENIIIYPKYFKN